MTTRAMITGELLCYMFDLPEGVYIDLLERVPNDDGSRPPMFRATLRVNPPTAYPLPDGDVDLHYQQRTDATAADLVSIEPVSRD